MNTRSTVFLLTFALLFANCTGSSVCYGDFYNGRLENGVKLPLSGKNFKSYSLLLSNLKRTYVHGTVFEIILNSLDNVYQVNPCFRYQYGETGKKKGGRFWPHYSHQNGCSVDFMVPLRDSENSVVDLPTHLLNKYGYSVELDANGRYKDYIIDFEAIALHIIELYKEAVRMGYGIADVIIAPEYHDELYKTQFGSELRQITNQDSIWYTGSGPKVRHDDHYHVNFSIPCVEL